MIALNLHTPTVSPAVAQSPCPPTAAPVAQQSMSSLGSAGDFGSVLRKLSVARQVSSTSTRDSASGAPSVANTSSQAIAATWPGSVAQTASAQAFGFDELGVFGLTGPAAARAAPPHMTGEPSGSALSNADAADPASKLATPATASAAGARTVATGAASATLLTRPAVYSAGPSLTADFGEVTVATVAPSAFGAATRSAPTTPGAEAGAAPVDEASPPETPIASSPINVLIAETQGGLQVVSTSPQLGPEALDRLRQGVAQVSDAFGVGVSELRHNGVSVGRCVRPPRKE